MLGGSYALAKDGLQLDDNTQVPRQNHTGLLGGALVGVGLASLAGAAYYLYRAAPRPTVSPPSTVMVTPLSGGGAIGWNRTF